SLGRAAAAARGAAGLLAQARQPAAGHALEAVAHVLLRLDQRSARQQQHGVLFGQAARHLDVIQIGQAGADVDRRRLAVAQRADGAAPSVVPRWAVSPPKRAGGAAGAAASWACTSLGSRPSTWAAEATSRWVRSAEFGIASTPWRWPTCTSTSAFMPGFSRCSGL